MTLGIFPVLHIPLAEGQDGLGRSGTIYFAFDQNANMPEAVSALDCHILNSWLSSGRKELETP